MTVYTAIERITPEMADRYLEANTHNRRMRNEHVTRLSNDMQFGRWQMNGASIVFNGDGTLLDGQHRLAAIVKAGVPVEMLVVRGVSRNAMQTIDANIARKPSDIALLAGYTNTNNLVGTVRLLSSIKDGLIYKANIVSSPEIMEFLRVHPHVQDSTNIACRLSKVVPVTIVGAWHYLAFYIGGQREKASAAVRVMETGIPEYPNDAIHAFRERLLRDKKSFQGNLSSRVRGFWTLAAAWNDFLADEPRLLCRTQQSEVKMRGVDYSRI